MIVAERYASALMGLADENGKTDKVRADMQAVHALCRNSHDFIKFLESPVIKTDKKLSVLSSVLKGKISDLSFSFIELITKKHRESYIKDIAGAFEEQYKKKHNILTAVVTTAAGLDATTREKMLELVKSQTRGEVDLVEKTDPATIGGFVLKIGDRQVDNSVARKLADMKKKLINKDLN
jgi:F-type H+-transporting ATPase subunit delta